MIRRMLKDKNYVVKKGSTAAIVRVQEFRELVKIKRKKEIAQKNPLNIINGKNHRKRKDKKNEFHQKSDKFIVFINNKLRYKFV